MKPFKLYRQHDQMDCGPTCLQMVAKHHGRKYSLQKLREGAGINREEDKRNCLEKGGTEQLGFNNLYPVW